MLYSCPRYLQCVSRVSLRGLSPCLVPTVPINPGITQFIDFTIVTPDEIGMVGDGIPTLWWIGSSHGVIVRIHTAVVEDRVVLGMRSILQRRFQVFQFIATMHGSPLLRALPSYVVKFSPKQSLIVKFIVVRGTTFQSCIDNTLYGPACPTDVIKASVAMRITIAFETIGLQWLCRCWSIDLVDIVVSLRMNQSAQVMFKRIVIKDIVYVAIDDVDITSRAPPA
jgi:hypothetical protein